MHRCTLAVFPSVYREGLPRFLLEAQAAGKPVVAYDVRGSRDAIENGRTGLLVPPADVDAFCQAAQRLLADEDLRRRLGEAGRRWVRGKFSLIASVRRSSRPSPWSWRRRAFTRRGLDGFASDPAGTMILPGGGDAAAG